MTVTCPLDGEDMGKTCDRSNCPFWSRKDPSGCWHGQDISLRNVSAHRGMTQSQLREYLGGVDNRVKRWIVFYHYACWCGDATPTEQDRAAWRRRKRRLPMCLPLFGFVSVERYARMRDPATLEHYEDTILEDRIVDLRNLLEI